MTYTHISCVYSYIVFLLKTALLRRPAENVAWLLKHYSFWQTNVTLHRELGGLGQILNEMCNKAKCTFYFLSTDHRQQYKPMSAVSISCSQQARFSALFCRHDEFLCLNQYPWCCILSPRLAVKHESFATPWFYQISCWNMLLNTTCSALTWPVYNVE